MTYISKPILFSAVFIVSMGFSSCRGLTHNQAETRPDHDDPSLRTRSYSLSYDVFFSTLLGVVKALPRWEVVVQDQEKGEILATRTSRLFRFVDDVRIQILKKGEGEIALDLHSTSRVGKGDFGQNARNIRELLNKLDQKTSN